MEAEAFAPAIVMPDWLRQEEQSHGGAAVAGDGEKLRFVIHLATENVRRGTGGPFGAAIFELGTDRLVAVGVNSVVPAGQSWAHAEMTAMARAQRQLGCLALRSCMLVSSCEPCAMCFGAIPWSGVRKLIYGAARTAAERVGFDEGTKVDDWQTALTRRGIAVVGPLLTEAAAEPFALYAQRGGIIY